MSDITHLENCVGQECEADEKELLQFLKYILAFPAAL